MSKQVAVLAVDPVNGCGLFQYLEAFYEHGISFKVFAVADTVQIKTNSGIGIQADDIVAHLKGNAGEYDALVFACGDAIPTFAQNAQKPYNVDMLEVIGEFGQKGKLMIGHCAAALIFEIAGITAGHRLAVHPLATPAIHLGTATDDAAVTDGNFYTARDENTIPEILTKVLDALK